MAKDVTVETSLVNVSGEVEEITPDGSKYNVTRFLGIPFMEPPAGIRLN